MTRGRVASANVRLPYRKRSADTDTEPIDVDTAVGSAEATQEEVDKTKMKGRVARAHHGYYLDLFG